MLLSIPVDAIGTLPIKAYASVVVGDSTLCKPPTTISGHSDYFRWLALDGNSTWRRQHWATILTCFDAAARVRLLVRMAGAELGMKVSSI
jgi:hypothetical protein